MNNESKVTGYPSIDKPWLKYYSEQDIQSVIPSRTIYEALLQENNKYLDSVAFHYYGINITFRELIRKTDIVADAFSSIGITQGDVVIISSLTIPEIIYSFYALNKIGAIPNMVDPRTSIEGIKEYCYETKAKCFVTLSALSEKMKSSCQNTDVLRMIVIDPANSLKQTNDKDYYSHIGDFLLEWNKFISLRTNGQQKINKYCKNECCVIVHTGGTTGIAKSVALTNDNLNSAAHLAIHSPLRLKRGDSFLNLMPPFISYGVVIGLHTALIEGWISIIVPQFELSQFDSLILQYRPNGIMGVPAYLEVLMNSSKVVNENLSFIKAVLVGGDNISSEFEQQINHFFSLHGCDAKLSKGYSMTEASASGTLSYDGINKYGSVGIPMCKTVISAFDYNTGEELPSGESGELCLQTPTIMAGYYNNTEETNRVLKYHRDGKRWLHSGDIGYVDKDGFVFVEGRIKRVIIRHDGFKVFPAQIESVLKKSDEIEFCCIIGEKDKSHIQGQNPVAFITKKQGCHLSNDKLLEELNALCKEWLPEYEQPDRIVIIDSMPLTNIGKIDYKKLEHIINI